MFSGSVQDCGEPLYWFESHDTVPAPVESSWPNPESWTEIRVRVEGKQTDEINGHLIPVTTCFSFQGACSLIVVLSGLLPLPVSFNASSCEPTIN